MIKETTGEQKTLFYINKKTGEVFNEDPGKENKNIKAIKENARVRRLLQRINGTNNRRKMHNLPKYRKPAWSRRKKTWMKLRK